MSSITRKLIILFASVIVSFALVLVFVFSWVSSRQINQDVQVELQSLGLTIKEDIESTGSMVLSRDRLDGLLRPLELEDVQVWIVNLEGRFSSLTQSHMGMMMRDRLSVSRTTQALIDDVFAGKTVLTQREDGIFDRETTTIGVPIVLDENIVAGLFISASNASINTLVATNLRVLWISLAIGMVMAIALGYGLSVWFLKPIHQANHSIKKMVEGHYLSQTPVQAKDELTQLNNNLYELSSRLHGAKLQSERLESMRRSFIADVTHELRTPVTVIRGLIESVRDGVLPATQIHEVTHHVLNEIEGIQRLIQDLLDLSKLEDPQFSLLKEPLRITQVIQDAIESSRLLASSKSIKIQDYLSPIEAIIEGDAQRLKQMLMIFLDNAIKYSKPQQSIIIRSWLEQGSFHVDIVDEGVGMDAPQLSEIFERYKTSNQAQGNGLGLLIAKRIADGHSISIDISSQKEKGTTVRLRFPKI